jgi:hypothetical protein
MKVTFHVTHLCFLQRENKKVSHTVPSLTGPPWMNNCTMLPSTTPPIDISKGMFGYTKPLLDWSGLS